MAKYLGLALLLITWFTAGCGPKMATEEQGRQGMDNIESMGDQVGADKVAPKK